MEYKNGTCVGTLAITTQTPFRAHLISSKASGLQLKCSSLMCEVAAVVFKDLKNKKA